MTQSPGFTSFGGEENPRRLNVFTGEGTKWADWKVAMEAYCVCANKQQLTEVVNSVKENVWWPERDLWMSTNQR